MVRETFNWVCRTQHCSRVALPAWPAGLQLPRSFGGRREQSTGPTGQEAWGAATPGFHVGVVVRPHHPGPGTPELGILLPGVAGSPSGLRARFGPWPLGGAPRSWAGPLVGPTFACSAPQFGLSGSAASDPSEEEEGGEVHPPRPPVLGRFQRHRACGDALPPSLVEVFWGDRIRSSSRHARLAAAPRGLGPTPCLSYHHRVIDVSGRKLF